MSVFKSLSHTDASYWVNARATYYPRITEIYIPNQPYEKLRSGMEAVTPQDSASAKEHSYVESSLERSMRRSKKMIKEYIFCNDFDLMATFTFAKDRDDSQRCASRMREWLKSQQKYHGKFDYVIVSELHKDDVSIHYHALFRAFTGKMVRAINPYTSKNLVKGGRAIYQFPGYRHGFTTVKLLGNKEEDRIRAGFYVMKYITKENVKFFGKNRYWTSRSLKRPKVEDNPQEWYMFVTPDNVYTTEYGSVFLFNNERIQAFLP